MLYFTGTAWPLRSVSMCNSLFLGWICISSAIFQDLKRNHEEKNVKCQTSSVFHYEKWKNYFSSAGWFDSNLNPFKYKSRFFYVILLSHVQRKKAHTVSKILVVRYLRRHIQKRFSEFRNKWLSINVEIARICYAGNKKMVL